ncbi:MAG: hypothetical protein Q9167_007556 [Letrouitia subvulpina]
MSVAFTADTSPLSAFNIQAALTPEAGTLRWEHVTDATKATPIMEDKLTTYVRPSLMCNNGISMSKRARKPNKTGSISNTRGRHPGVSNRGKGNQHKDTDTRKAVVDFSVSRNTPPDRGRRPSNLKTTFAVADDENGNQTRRPRSPYPGGGRSRDPIKGAGRWSKEVVTEELRVPRQNRTRCSY